MTLNTRDRSVLFESLSKLADPEAVDAMLAHFPTREVDEPLTRDYLDSRLTEFREEIRVTLLTEFRAFDAKLGAFDAKLGAFDAKLESVRQEMSGEMAMLRRDVEAKLLRSLQWTVGTMLTLAAIVIAVVALG